jgi:pimeloyl-ACP methyl ester carboxylesterase
VTARRRALPATLRGLAWTAAAAIALVAAWVGGNAVRARLVETASETTLAPPGGRWLDAGDVQMFAQEWGQVDAPTIVLAHGTGAWSGTWFGTPAFLAAHGWHVVAVDLPPFGFTRRTDPAPLDYRRAAQGRRLLRALQAISPRPVVLLGHSFGAGPALEAALREPARVRQLVLVDPALGLTPDGRLPACAATPPAWPLASRPARTALVAATATVPWFSATLLRQFVHRRDVVTAQALVPYRRPFGRREFGAQLGDWAATFSSDDCVGAASADAQAVADWSRHARLALIWGAEDTITPPAQGVALGRLTGTTPAFIDGVGHIPHLEDPDRFHDALRAAIGDAAR